MTLSVLLIDVSAEDFGRIVAVPSRMIPEEALFSADGGWPFAPPLAEGARAWDFPGGGEPAPPAAAGDLGARAVRSDDAFATPGEGDDVAAPPRTDAYEVAGVAVLSRRPLRPLAHGAE